MGAGEDPGGGSRCFSRKVACVETTGRVAPAAASSCSRDTGAVAAGAAPLGRGTAFAPAAAFGAFGAFGVTCGAGCFGAAGDPPASIVQNAAGSSGPGAAGAETAAPDILCSRSASDTAP